jgi:hypothetical protein
MWIRKLPVQVNLERRFGLFCATLVDVSLGAIAWFLLVELSVVVGILSPKSVSLYVGVAVVIFILPAAWLSNLRARRRDENTLVCCRCNIVREADSHKNSVCKCGGRFVSLAEVKWVDNKPAKSVLLPGRHECALAD